MVLKISKLSATTILPSYLKVIRHNGLNYLTLEIISLQYLYQEAKDLSFTLASYVNFFKHRFGATLLICA